MIQRIALGVLILALAVVEPARAGLFENGIAALRHHDYVLAANAFGTLAERGDARAQAHLGYLYANGYGVPQDYIVAARWYRVASEQGDPHGQYFLGLMYDKGQGVPQDYIEAYKWLDLAVAAASGRDRQDWAKIRDAIASKLTLAEITIGQARAFAWQAARGR